MKVSKESKKSYKKKLFWALFLMVVLPFFFSFAQNAEELRNEINQKNSEIEKIEAQIKSYQSQLNSLSKEKNTLSGQIKQLDLTRNKLNADISLTEAKINKANLTILELTKDINIKQNDISKNSSAISYSLRSIHQEEKENFLIKFLSENKISESWNSIQSLLNVSEVLRSKVSNLKNIKYTLEENKKEEIYIKEELDKLKTQLSNQKKIIEENKNEKNRLLILTKNNESNYQKMLKEQNARKDAIEKEIQEYESKLKFILDPNTLPSGRVLSWPLDNIFVTQLFGRTVAAQRLYASGSHSGVDFRASVGTPVKAMADGVVIGVGDTDETCPNASFGKWILIDYNNGLASAFGHMSLNSVKVGQKVKRGEVVGYSGATGRVTGPHLHITIYASNAVKVDTLPSRSCVGKTLTQPMAPTNAYLDPMIYLPVYKN